MMVDNITVDGLECIFAWKYKFIPFMQRTGQNMVVADGVAVQRQPIVQRYLKRFGINMVYAAKVKGEINYGYPPYSHCFMPLDHRTFGPFQQRISRQCREYDNTRQWGLLHDNKEALLYDLIEPLFMEPSIVKLSVNDIAKYDDIAREVLRRNGNIKDMK